MMIVDAAGLADSEGSEPGKPPAHCPHPRECLRLPLREPRSFRDQTSTSALPLNRYRLMMAQQCACNRLRQS